MFDLIGAGIKIIDKVIPNRQQADEAKLKLLELQQAGELKLSEFENNILIEQAKINQIEAQSPSLFKSGWRPALAWCCTLAFIYDYSIRPILSSFLSRKGYIFPELNSSELYALIFGLLGLAGVRSFDKMKGLTK